MPQVIRKCQECGKDFWIHSYHVARGFGLFCSRACKGQHDSRQKKGKPNATCEYCGNAYHVKPRLLKTTRYCSRECKDNARTEEINQRISQGLERYWENASEEARLKVAMLALK